MHYTLVISALLSISQLGTSVSTPTRPNIILIVADDLGWGDTELHGSPEIPTPNLAALAADGVLLQNYYVQPICTPSRSALMTAKHPIHTGLQHNTIGGGEPYGLGLEHKLLPQYLREIGYVNHIIGKWHLGMHSWPYTPLFRGFDSHFGYYNGHEDYWTHYAQPGPNKSFYGLDFWDQQNVVRSDNGSYSTELFTQRAEHIIENHDKSKPLFLYVAQQAVHAGNGYDPLEAPQRYIHRMSHIKHRHRRVFAGMVSALDESVGNVSLALHRQGMLNNTILVFTTDNGGPVNGYDGNAACNWPLRGSKHTLWEGGVRGTAFVWSPLLFHQPYSSHHLMHITDWLPTLLKAAGYDQSKLPVGLDGTDMWDTLSKNLIDSPRKEMLHNIEPVFGYWGLRKGDWKLIGGRQYGGHHLDGWYPPASVTQPLIQRFNHTEEDIWYQTKHMRPFNMNGQATHEAKALNLERFEDLSPNDISADMNNNTVIGDYFNKLSKHNSKKTVNNSKLAKILALMGRGPRKFDKWSATDCGPKPSNASTNCNPAASPCLYNIRLDPCEYNNVAARHPGIVQKLLHRLDQYRATQKPMLNKPVDPKGLPIHHNGTWVPWLKA